MDRGTARTLDAGPSPPARGSPLTIGDSATSLGSIPACAGEPWTGAPASDRARVHPRLRGGALSQRGRNGANMGPSPPARGSLPHHRAVIGAEGSIPACAGEPCCETLGYFLRRVHPRLRGGAGVWPLASAHVRGPSPPARGSPQPLTNASPPGGSIPACAGEPRSAPRAQTPRGVHPRLRGGAYVPPARPGIPSGPSPPARGSRRHPPTPRIDRGSIPACARGAGWDGRPLLAYEGPSPPARGSRPSVAPDSDVKGSIPACAGEPSAEASRGRPRRVHPRLRGGAPCLRR